jgi:hypothetical protein
MDSLTNLPRRGVVLAIVLAGHSAVLWSAVAMRGDTALRDQNFIEIEQRPFIARFLSDTAADSPVASSFISVSSIPATLDSISVEPPPPIEALAADSFEQARFVRTAIEAAEVARLQGVYRSQLLARLARLLESRNVSADELHGCSINVIQNERGQVVDVLTDLCGLGAPQQDIIRQVVRAASPLPLPPAGLAAGSYLTLDLAELSAAGTVR